MITIAGLVVGPFGVTVDGEGFHDTFVFGSFVFIGGRDECCSARKGADGGKFVTEGCVGIEWDVLVCVGGFSVDIKGQNAIVVSSDGNVEHGNSIVLFFFLCPFDVGVNAVDESEKRCDVVFVDGCDGVIRLLIMPPLQQSNFHRQETLLSNQEPCHCRNQVKTVGSKGRLHHPQ